VLSMKQFLASEAVTGGLKHLPPRNSSDLWGTELWKYLDKVADERPMLGGKWFAFSDRAGDYNLSESLKDPYLNTSARLKTFSDGRDSQLVQYTPRLQEAHHIHFSGNEQYRLLQHFYAFAFFADSEMQSFYRRFIRDYMRYKDDIQCAGHELVAKVRRDAKLLTPEQNGAFYALHIRRGDLQFKEVKIGAEQMVKNLKYPNGTSMIPPGSLLYLSTDDPDGLCKGCLVRRKPCETFEKGKKPPGCPEDTSWDAFRKAGLKIKFLRDYLDPKYKGNSLLQNSNPNTHGMLESIVCSRADLFAGTYFSTFTGYIHR
jgi:hypothetical protein